MKLNESTNTVNLDLSEAQIDLILILINTEICSSDVFFTKTELEKLQSFFLRAFDLFDG